MVTSNLVVPTPSVFVAEVKVEAVGEILMSYPRTHYCSNIHQAKILKIVFLKVTNKRVMM